MEINNELAKREQKSYISDISQAQQRPKKLDLIHSGIYATEDNTTLGNQSFDITPPPRNI